MGREHGPVHERGAGSGDDVAPQAGRPAGDPHRAWRRLPARLLRRGPVGLRGRVLRACLATFALGLALPYPAIAVIRPLIESFTWPTESWQQANLCIESNRCEQPFNTAVQILVTIGLVVVLGLIVWLFRVLTRQVVRPMAGMIGTVRQMGPQNLGQRITWAGSDEFRELADTVNGMLDRVAVGFEGQRRFAANASHELRTPLAVQRTLVEVAMTTSNGADPELNRLGAQLLLVNERNERLIEGLLVLAESDRGLVGTVPVRLDELMAAALDQFAEFAAERGVELRRGLVERTVQGDPVLLERMVGNLLHNAIKYNEAGGWVEVVVADRPAIAVHNTGQRVPAGDVPALFEPFRRLTAGRTNHRDSAGLGLSIVRSIVTAHQGTVSAEPGTNGGLRVTVALP